MSAMRGRVRSRGTVLHGWVVAAAGLLLLLLQAPLALAQTVYFHNDVLGSPVVATDANGAVLWKQQYRPYGQPAGAGSGGVGESRLGFGGKPYEAGHQLSYFGARYYEPGSGRFIGIDPKEAEAGDLHSINRYAYANNNPYRYIDPDGAQAIPLVVMPGGGLGRLGGFAVAPPLQSLPGRSGAEARLYDLPGYQPAPGSEGSSSPGFTMLPPQGAVLLAFWALVQPAADFLSFAARGTAAADRAANVARGIPESQLGPSGKPKIHVKEHATRKRAEDAALDRSRRGEAPEEHSNPTKGDPHFHPSGSNSREHHTYPGRGFPHNE